MKSDLNIKIDESKCSDNCNGNNKQKCGGFWANSIYETGIESKYLNLDIISLFIIQIFQ